MATSPKDGGGLPDRPAHRGLWFAWGALLLFALGYLAMLYFGNP